MNLTELFKEEVKCTHPFLHVFFTWKFFYHIYIVLLNTNKHKKNIHQL